MTDLTQAKNKLKYWQEQYQKAYDHYNNTWDFELCHASIECKRWKTEINRLKDEDNDRAPIQS